MARHCRWYFDVTKWFPTQSEWTKLTASIGEEEVTRINKFVYRSDAKSSLIGHALIRKFLHTATGLESSQFQLTRAMHGRPILSPIDGTCVKHLPHVIDFNVSHSGSYCVLAGIFSTDESYACPQVSIGVDVTKIVKKNTKQELDRFLQLMSRREFTKNEWKFVEQAQDDRQKCINFTRLWCLKESFIKSIGLGLSYKLERIDFNLADDGCLDTLKRCVLSSTKVSVDLEPPAENWLFYETAIDDEHIVAIGYHICSTHLSADADQLIPSQSVIRNTTPFVELSIDEILDSLTPLRQVQANDWEKFVSRESKAHVG